MNANIDSFYNLRINPFRVTPSNDPNQIFWAGFGTIRNKIEARITNAMRIPNSSLVLNWGEYGSGKTHAMKYFGKQEVLRALAPTGQKAPLFIGFALPKGKAPARDIFLEIFDKLDVPKIRSLSIGENWKVDNCIDSSDEGEFVKSAARLFFNKDVSSDLVLRFFYDTCSTNERTQLSNHGVLKKFNSENDYIKTLGLIFNVLLSQSVGFPLVILWIDEFEEISVFSKVNQTKVTAVFRELLDSVPDRLLMMMNFTQSALFDFADLSIYVSPALETRVRDRINFALPNLNEFLEYTKDLLLNCRLEEDRANVFSPFSEEMLRKVYNDLSEPTLRRLNEALSLIIEVGLLNQVKNLNLKFYESHKHDILWK